jgi:hypothetical protein
MIAISLKQPAEKGGLGGRFLLPFSLCHTNLLTSFSLMTAYLLAGAFPVLSESMDGEWRSWISACLFTAYPYTQYGMVS